jgi:hypothetical protein
MWQNLDNMFNQAALAELGRKAVNAVPAAPGAEEVVYAYMVAPSHQLEGLDTSVEAVLEAAYEHGARASA